MSFLRLLAVSFVGLFGDPTYLWRVSVCLLAGVAGTALTYWLYPAVLPIWPGAVLILGAAAIGATWERCARSSDIQR